MNDNLMRRSEIIAIVNRLVTAINAVGIKISGPDCVLTDLQTDVKTDLVAALNSVKANITGLIDDSAEATDKVYSSTKVMSEVAARIDALIGTGITARLDTLVELGQLGEENEDKIDVLIDGLANTVKIIAQTLTPEQQQIARTNIGAASAADMTDEKVLTTVAYAQAATAVGASVKDVLAAHDALFDVSATTLLADIDAALIC